MDESKYIYPKEELDNVIEKMKRGLSPMIPDAMMLEVKMRIKELEREIYDDVDDDEIDIENELKHDELLKQKIEDERRKASIKDVCLIKFSEKQKQQILEDASSSFVRVNPNSKYNKMDDELYETKEKKEIFEKLLKVRSVYYNTADYQNAIAIIAEAILYSLGHDYPWLSKEEALQSFKDGEIKFTYCKIPELILGYTTPIKDPKTLKGIITGDITVLDESEKPKPKKHKKNAEVKGVYIPYNVIDSDELQYYINYHNHGYDTPISGLIKSGYSRLAMPNNNILGIDLSNNSNSNYNGFDWMHEGAGKEYFEKMHNIKSTPRDLAVEINKDHNMTLDTELSTKMTEFMNQLTIAYNGGYSSTRNDNITSNTLQVNQKALQVEHAILNAIKNNNPNL